VSTGTRLRFLDASLGIFGAWLIAACAGAPWWAQVPFWVAFIACTFIGSGFRFRYRREGK
jgi:hypothetical protein